MVKQHRALRVADLILIALVGFGLGGCPPLSDLFPSTNPSSNVSPVASAGPDQTAVGGRLVALNGTASYDPEGGALAYAWTQTAGNQVKLSDPAAALPTFTAPLVAQTLTFQLTVTNTAGNSASASVKVTVQVNLLLPPTGP